MDWIKKTICYTYGYYSMNQKPLTTKVINQKPDNRLKVVSNQKLHREWLIKQINKELKEKENQNGKS